MIIAYSLRDRGAAARVRAAFSSTCRSIDKSEMRELIEASGTCAAILFDEHAVAHLGMAFFESLSCRRRTVAMVLYPSTRSLTVPAVFQLGRYGIDGVCAQGEGDSPTELREIVERARIHAASANLIVPLADIAPSLDQRVWSAILANAPYVHTTNEMALALNISPRGLQKRLREAGLPSARRLLAWCRLLRAATLLEDAARTTESVGLAVNFASGTAFRNACQYLVRSQPKQIRSRGGATYVLQQLTAEIRASSDSDRCAGQAR